MNCVTTRTRATWSDRVATGSFDRIFCLPGSSSSHAVSHLIAAVVKRIDRALILSPANFAYVPPSPSQNLIWQMMD